MTQDSDQSILQTWTENPVATGVALAVGAVIGAGIAVGVEAFVRAGDEAPIRVRNGSVILEVVHPDRHWKQIGSDGKRWRLNKGVRTTDAYQLYLTPTNPADCGGNVGPQAHIVEYFPDDHSAQTPGKITVQTVVTGNKWRSEVTSDRPLGLSGDEKTLTYGSEVNYIQSLRLNNSGTPHCTFGAKDTNFKSLHGH